MTRTDDWADVAAREVGREIQAARMAAALLRPGDVNAATFTVIAAALRAEREKTAERCIQIANERTNEFGSDLGIGASIRREFPAVARVEGGQDAG